MGRVPYGAIGALIPRDPNNKFNPLAGINRYVGLIIDKGYAVAHTMRSSDRLRGDVKITLEDGAKLDNYNLSSHAGLITSWGQLARNMISKRIGGRPARNYFYRSFRRRLPGPTDQLSAGRKRRCRRQSVL